MLRFNTRTKLPILQLFFVQHCELRCCSRQHLINGVIERIKGILATADRIHSIRRDAGQLDSAKPEDTLRIAVLFLQFCPLGIIDVRLEAHAVDATLLVAASPLLGRRPNLRHALQNRCPGVESAPGYEVAAGMLSGGEHDLNYAAKVLAASLPHAECGSAK